MKAEISKIKKWKFWKNENLKKVPSRFRKVQYKQYWTFWNLEGTIDKNYKIRAGKRPKNTKKKFDQFFTSAKHAWVSLVKIWMGQMGRLEEKNNNNTFVLTPFISFGLFNIFHYDTPPPPPKEPNLD
jgi:hypothetical protein